MKVALGSVALLLLIAACGGGDPEGGRPAGSRSTSASPSPSPAFDAQQRWAAERSGLIHAATGHFEVQILVDGLGTPVDKQSGNFDLTSGSFKVDRTVLTNSGLEIVTAKETPDHQGYLQMRDWGTWSGCWLPIDPSALGFSSGTGAMLLPISALLAVKVTDRNQPDSEIRGQVDAATAVQLLGFSSEAVKAMAAKIQRAQVPMTLTFYEDRDRILGALDGSDVLKALGSNAQLPGAFAGVSKRHVTLNVSEIGGSLPAVSAPNATELLPPNAKKSDTCAANR